MNPGQTALTVTPVAAVSSASARTRPDNGVLRGAIGADIRIALETGGRGDGDDAAEAALRHRPEHRLDRVHHAHEVHLDHAPKQRGVRPREGRRSAALPALAMQEIHRRRRRASASRTASGSVTSATVAAWALARARRLRRAPRGRGPRRHPRARGREAAAMARPIPRLPPVTTACRPRSPARSLPALPPCLAYAAEIPLEVFRRLILSFK